MHPKSYETLDDAELMGRLQQGSTPALSVLYDRYSGQLTTVCSSFRLTEGIGEEVVNECFLELWQQRERLQPTTVVVALLKTIARRRVIDAIRKQALRQKVEHLYAERRDWAHHSTAHDVETSELNSRLAAGIESLPTGMRAVFELQQQGHSVQEISQKLSLSSKTVEEQLRRAQKRLRALLR